MKVPKIVTCVAIGCCGLALIFQIVAVAGTGWLVSDGTQIGLFRSCILSVCVDMNSDSAVDWWKACQAFSILGLLAVAGALVVGVLHFFVENTQMLSVGGNLLCIGTVVFLLIELAVFGGKTGDRVLSNLSPVKYGYGFSLSVVACILSLIGSILFAVGKQ